jgi:hypothetical protein
VFDDDELEAQLRDLSFFYKHQSSHIHRANAETYELIDVMDRIDRIDRSVCSLLFAVSIFVDVIDFALFNSQHNVAQEIHGQILVIAQCSPRIQTR